jgi:hypothetical protein
MSFGFRFGAGANRRGGDKTTPKRYSGGKAGKAGKRKRGKRGGGRR